MYVINNNGPLLLEQQMSSPSPVFARMVPWTGIDEWRFVKDALFDNANTNDLGLALELGEVWRLRGKLPVAVDATLNLRRLQLILASGVYDPVVMQLALSAAVLRMVNELVDPVQRGQYALPVMRLAENLGVPRVLVDIRHESTHDALPTLPTLELAIKLALDWLYANYWEPYSLASLPSTLKDKIEGALTQISALNSPEMEVKIKAAQKILFSEVEYVEHSREKQAVLANAIADHKWLTSASYELVEHVLERANALSSFTVELFLVGIVNELVINETLVQKLSLLVAKPLFDVEHGDISRLLHSLMHHVSVPVLSLSMIFFSCTTVSAKFPEHVMMFSQLYDAYMGTSRSIPIVSAEQVESVLEQIQKEQAQVVQPGPVVGWKPLPLGCSPEYDPVKNGFYKQLK